ncbi:unnamed protein product [Albugo candida]|uniref:Uncharacterized protein n=1 Tax=Albugo candida TaxID=65357 RepID=A0A024FU63_9STRA|nr:unnamed protein product [Albugo candida]|eukprot:CCI10693.1 unnamed protein product [Albugo candida]
MREAAEWRNVSRYRTVSIRMLTKLEPHYLGHGAGSKHKQCPEIQSFGSKVGESSIMFNGRNYSVVGAFYEQVEIISYTTDKGGDECREMASISQQMNVLEKENRELRAKKVNDLQESSKKAAIKRDHDYEDRHVSARYAS